MTPFNIPRISLFSPWPQRGFIDIAALVSGPQDGTRTDLPEAFSTTIQA